MDTRRPLTDAENALVRTTFGDAVDPTRVAVNRRRWWPFQGRNVVMAPDGEIWCHPDGPTWRACYATSGFAWAALFLHEMTHVWQAQRSGRWWLPLMRHPWCRYRYTYRPGKAFALYGIEQQAEIVSDAYLLRHGGQAPGAPSLAALEAILPFRLQQA
jgi:hypothetical protein